MIKKKSKISAGKVVAIGAGVASVGAGAYYFLGPKGKEHQKKAKALVAKIKIEVQKKAKQAKNISKPIYHDIVDAMARTYSKEYKEHAKEINAVVRKLKGEWKVVERRARPLVKKAKKIAKKSK